MPSNDHPLLTASSRQTEENVLFTFLTMSTHQCTASFAFEALFNNANHVTLNLSGYWLSVDNFMYPTNHATRRITRFTLLAGPFAFREPTYEEN